MNNMLDERRLFIQNVLEQLDELSKNNYGWFEIALVIWLRSDLHTFNYYIDDYDISKIEKILDDVSSIMDEDLRYTIDDIITCEEDV